MTCFEGTHDLGEIDHGHPTDFGVLFSPGRQSAAHNPYSGRAYVFTYGQKDLGHDTHLLLREKQGWSGTWVWRDLGTPPSGHDIEIVSSPTAVVYCDASACDVSVFVVMREAGVGAYPRLFERRRSGFAFGPWIDHGRPPLPPGYSEDNYDYILEKWLETPSAVAWELDGVQRVNLFGTVTLEAAGGSPHPCYVARRGASWLVDFYFDGQQWHWGGLQDIVEDGRQMGLAVGASVAIDDPTYDRISSFIRSSSGRVWERHYAIDDGAHSGWALTDLTEQPWLVTSGY